MKTKSIFISLCIGLLLAQMGCAVELNQPAAATPQTQAQPASTENPQTGGTSWSGLNLNGKLIYSTFSADQSPPTTRIHMLNLATSENKNIFTETGNAWVYYLSVALDGKSLVMAFAPPTGQNIEPITALYILPLEENAEPQSLLEPKTAADRYIQVEWSPDGKYIYFVQYNLQQQPSNETFPHFNIYRLAYPDGTPEKIIDRGFWPRLSADSTKLVYVSVDPVSGVNKLFVANADGSEAHEIALSGPVASHVLDAPIFSLDGMTILFSAPTPAAAYQPNWLDRVMGIQIAKAHNVPSDWWSVPVVGGTATQLTHLQTIKLFASISPDKKRIASESGEGIFVMDPDGSNITQLLVEPSISSPINWIP